MSIKTSLLASIEEITLPDVWSICHDSKSLSIRHLFQREVTLPCKVEGLRSLKQFSIELIATLGSGEKVVIWKRKKPSSSTRDKATRIIRAPRFTLEGKRLRARNKMTGERLAAFRPVRQHTDMHGGTNAKNGFEMAPRRSVGASPAAAA